MGCSACFADDPPGQPESTMLSTILRDKKHIYKVTFPTRPLYITLTSSKYNNGGYITAFDRLCPVENAKENIVLQSKVIYVNDLLVEVSDMSVIAYCLQQATLPMTLTLVHPEGLGDKEVPDMNPDTILHLHDTWAEG